MCRRTRTSIIKRKKRRRENRMGKARIKRGRIKSDMEEGSREKRMVARKLLNRLKTAGRG